MTTAAKVRFSAKREAEVNWRIVIDDQEISVSEKHVEELVRRFLLSRSLRAVDDTGQVRALPGLYG